MKATTLGSKEASVEVGSVIEFKGLAIKIDRPKGFVQKGKDHKGNPWERKYKYNYGYIKGTKGGDGDELDVFLGPDRNSDEAYWAIQTLPDGSFDEYKCFVGFPNRDAAISAYREHIPKKLMRGMVTMKLDMMKSMLGIEPEKVATVIGIFDELRKISELEGVF